jgi:hypothetical protein
MPRPNSSSPRISSAYDLGCVHRAELGRSRQRFGHVAAALVILASVRLDPGHTH